MTIKNRFIANLDKLECIAGYKWELIADKHSSYILKWRNDPNNAVLFEDISTLTIEKQKAFLNRYDEHDRVDLVLVKDDLIRINTPVGVFNIKNLGTSPEYGALIGDETLRNKSLGYNVKVTIFRFWFDVMKMKEILVKNKIQNQKVIENNLKMGFKPVKLEPALITSTLTADLMK
ncbi:N-acetyltransferase [Albibacterium bauzanense]|uniref:RimJ/RimL family protein N-acetyltransferase n=1 Tax=Albibacterium bauzanense TaxID=653929 RepID=A0A4R1LZA3_9SPHI|nr:N-acetyltransferase [Albibacterium bauzanense]TCK84916.1 hypothetical protein C8N28_0212 [Albibacterium bauzanense]